MKGDIFGNKVDDMVGISFKCQKSDFHTSLEKYRNISSLHISTLGFANISNWKSCNARNDQICQGGTSFITIVIHDKAIVNSLCGQLSSKSRNFGVYISVSNDNRIKDILDFGLLAPTADECMWCIRILNNNPVSASVDSCIAPFRISPVYPSARDFEFLISKRQPVIASPLVINDSYSQLLESASMCAADLLDITQLDIGVRPIDSSNLTLSSTSPEKVLKTIDPLQFLTDKYFTTLYSASTMLEHFVKSSIPKMNLLRRDNLKLAKDCLSRLLIETLSDFDRRYDVQNEHQGILKLDNFQKVWLSDEKLLDEMERSFRLDHLKQQNFTQNMDLDKLNEFMDKMKLKDLKLQILLDLELLRILKYENESEKKEVQENDEKTVVESRKEKRPSLVSKRYSGSLVGKKKRLIPTLLGTVIPTSMDFDVDFRFAPEEDKKRYLTIDAVEKLVKIFFDKLCVYDAIMGLDYKDLNSSWGFLSNCVIPFYGKDHRQLLKLLAIKSRGPAFTLKIKSRREQKQRQERRKEKLEKAKDASYKTVNTERKTSSIDLSKIRLKRSHSSFNNSKADLSRKTISMVNSTSIVSSAGDLGPSNDLLHPPDLAYSADTKFPVEIKGFMKSKKRKLQAPKRKPPKLQSDKSDFSVKTETNAVNKLDIHEVQEEMFRRNQVIEATPRKNTSASLDYLTGDLVSIISPYQEKSSRKQDIDPTTTQITETPAFERVQIRPGVFEIGSSPLKSSDSPHIKSSKVNEQWTGKGQQIYPSTTKLSVSTSTAHSNKTTKRKLDFS